MGFDVRSLSNPLPKKRSELEKVVAALATGAQFIRKAVMQQFKINQEAAVAYLPTVVDELADQTEAMVVRAETHFAAAKRANVTSLPQADGDDGQLTDNPPPAQTKQ